MARAKRNGCNVYVLFVCVGDVPQYGGESKVTHREEETKKAMDFLKIDGAFVKDIVDDPVDLAMVRSINDVGTVMGKATIAEFVENEEILRMLSDIGVDYAQGYGIGRPTPAEETK